MEIHIRDRVSHNGKSGIVINRKAQWIDGVNRELGTRLILQVAWDNGCTDWVAAEECDDLCPTELRGEVYFSTWPYKREISQ